MSALKRLDAARALLDRPAPAPVPGQLAVEDGPRIGSLCSGYGGLDMAAAEVFGASVAWHAQYDPADRHQWAARILAHHWPDVPNVGDITAVQWQRVLDLHGRVDVLTAGFPCQDVSCAGCRAGIAPGTRSGLWAHVALAASVLLPEWLVIENVEGLLSARADRGMGPDGTPLDVGGAPGALRALGAVLGDLAGLGFDAEWVTVPASGVGAVHQRKRVFVLARRAAADTSHLGHERCGGAWCRGDGPADRGYAPADTDRKFNAEEQPRAHIVIGERPTLAGRAVELAGSSRGGRPSRRASAAQPATSGSAAAVQSSCSAGNAWAQFAPAVARWEALTGRPAPGAVDDRGRLAPEFVEWMMGLPAGHVTSVPGVPRRAQLKALGNGVVPQQAVYALRLLLGRYAAEAAARVTVPA